MKNNHTEVDFVILWLDSSDPQWISEYNLHSNEVYNENVRYRNNDLFKYIFRSFEKYTPWVRKIHFVTYGHIPNWMNTKHPKINVVKHKDFMPQEFLPTFSSHPIELNLHRIEGLCENFVYFNDDMYILNHLERKYFFKNGLPRDCGKLTSFVPTYDVISNIVYNNMNVINKYFTMKDIKRKKGKWMNFVYKKHLFKNSIYIFLNRISAFEENHLPHSFNKSILVELWEKEGELLRKTSMNKFRNKDDVNQWLFRYWQLSKNHFYPRNDKAKSYLQLDDDINLICSIIEEQSINMVCINDADVEDYISRVEMIENSFEKILPEKSKFEV